MFDHATVSASIEQKSTGHRRWDRSADGFKRVSMRLGDCDRCCNNRAVVRKGAALKIELKDDVFAF